MAFSGQMDPENGWGEDGRAVTPRVGVIHEDIQRAHVVKWNPARVLAECNAKRRIVERHAPHELPLGPICDYCSHVPEAVEWPCPDLRDVISVFADHPG